MSVVGTAANRRLSDAHGPALMPTVNGGSWGAQNRAFNHELNNGLGCDYSYGYGFSYIKVVFVIILFLVSLISFVTQTELTSMLYSSYEFNEPMLLLFLTHGTWWTLWPLQFISIASYKTIRRFVMHILGYEDLGGKKWKGFRRAFASSVKAQHRNIFHTAELTTETNKPDYEVIYRNPKKSFRYYSEFFHSEAFKHLFIMSACLSIILNVAGSTWYISMSLSTGSDVTAIYNCSAFTAYVFAIPLLREKFSWIKANSVVTAVVGVIVVAYTGAKDLSDGSNYYPHRLLGNLIIFLGAILYGLYEVLYKKWCCPPSEVVSARRQATFSNFIMCLIGIATCITMGVCMLVIHVSGLHRFHIPTESNAVLIMLLSVFSNHIFSVCFLGLMSLTSPVFSSVASLLTILIVGIFEWSFRGVFITIYQVGGYILIMVGFSLLTYASWNEITQQDNDDEYITDSESTYSSSSSQHA